MRIDKVIIKSFGPLRDQTRDHSVGTEGLHVVYGPNESGKSLSLAALELGLFGVPRAIEGFGEPDLQQIHLRLTLSRMDTDGSPESLTFTRTRLGAFREDGTPVDASTLDRYFGGVTRETFERTYGLSSDRIRQGGRLIKESKGDVATALYGAATGLERIRQTELRLRKESAELFLADRKAKKPAINSSLVALAASLAEFRNVNNRPDATEALEKTLAAYKAELRSTEAALKKLEARTARIAFLRACSLSGRELHAVRTRLDAQDAPPLLAVDFLDRLEKGRTGATVASQASQRIDTELADLRNEHDGITVDEAVLQAGAEIAELKASISLLTKIDRDIPIRTAELTSLTQEIENKLGQIEATTGAALREGVFASPQLHDTIRTLITEKAGIDSDVSNRSRELSDAKLRTVELADELEMTPEASPVPEQEANLAVLRDAGDLESKLATIRETLRRREQEYIHACTLLDRLKTDVAPERIPVPGSAEVRAAREADRAFEIEIGTQAERHRSANHAIDLHKRSIAHLEQDGALPAEGELERVRAERDALLEKIRSNLAAAIAVDHATAMTDLARLVAEADAVADRLRAQAEKATRREHLRSQIDEQSSVHDDAARRLEQLRSERAEASQRWLDRWNAIGVNAGPPIEMESWLDRHKDCCERAAELVQLRHDITGLEQTTKEHRRNLTVSLGAMGIPLPSGDMTRKMLLALATVAIGHRHTTIKSRELKTKELMAARHKEGSAQQLNDEAGARLAKWITRWGDTMRSLNQPELVSTDTGAFLLDTMQAIAGLHAKCEDKRQRLDDMENTRTGILATARNVADSVCLPFDERSVESLAKTTDDRCRAADQALSRREQLAQDIGRKRDALDSALRQEELSQATLTTLRQEARAQTDDDLSAAWDKSVRHRKLLDDRDHWTQQFLAAAGGEDAERLLHECLLNTDMELELELNAIREKEKEAQDDRDRLRDSIKEYEVRKQSLGGDRAASVWSDCHAHATAVLDRAEQYVPARLALIALTTAARRYREEHHAPMLSRASDIFRTITRGEYDELRVAENDLFAVRSGSKSAGLKVAQMSDGTQDQVYLALRLAALGLAHATNAEPLPLILDDGLVHFDDDRTAAMLELLAEASDTMQVIVFTHHRSVVTSARDLQARRPGKVFIQELANA